jgi:hypothetical protein
VTVHWSVADFAILSPTQNVNKEKSNTMQNINFCTRWIIALALALGAALVLSACNDNRSQDTSATDSIDPCALVTSTEAAEALGVANVNVGRPDEANIPLRLGTCLYTGEVGDGVAVLNVMVRHGYSLAESTVGFEGMRETYAGAGGVVDVPGIGEQAYWIGDLSQLWVLQGILQLGVSGDISLDKARMLAGRAVERLNQKL